ncbi:hypothetical protein Tco_1541531 [Tanacetum coccineum]
MTQINCSREAFKDDQYILEKGNESTNFGRQGERSGEYPRQDPKPFAKGDRDPVLTSRRTRIPPRWTEIYEGINQHLQTSTTLPTRFPFSQALKADPTSGTYTLAGGDQAGTSRVDMPRLRWGLHWDSIPDEYYPKPHVAGDRVSICTRDPHQLPFLNNYRAAMASHTHNTMMGWADTMTTGRW